MNDCKYCNIGVGSEYEAGHSLQIENAESITGDTIDIIGKLDIRAVVSEDYDYNKFINVFTTWGDFVILAKYCPGCGREL